ncbi:hypothetical protein NDA16_001843 [Ustilago loliicola]|nr:hypothetical protein NDA16_001843 [Ustilago loliicola]
MARITLFNAILATFVLVTLGASAESTLPNTSSLPTPPVELDDDGNPLQFFNSVIGDDDDDDYTPAELEQRSPLRRGKHHHKHSSHKSSALSRKLFTLGPEPHDELWSPKV